VVGDGPTDLAYLSPFNNLDVVWENPLYARLFRAPSSFARVIVIDRRGTGVSDRYSPDDLPPLEDLADDLAAVLDAVGSERAVLSSFSDAGALCAMLASTRPDRVAGLILYATVARGRQAPDYPWQWSDDEWRDYLEEVRTGWGSRSTQEHRSASSTPHSAATRRWRPGGNGSSASPPARAPSTRRSRSSWRWTSAGCCLRSACRRSCSTAATIRPSRPAPGTTSQSTSLRPG